MKPQSLRILFAAAFCGLSVHPCYSQSAVLPVTYSAGDMANWTPGYVITGFGLDGIGSDGTAGQTFRIDNGNALVTSITYPIVTDNSPTDYQVGVAAWNGTQLTGPLLYLSGTLSATPTPGSYQLVTINPNNLLLTQGLEYVLFFTSDSFYNTGEKYNVALGYVPAGGYSEGQYFGMAGYQQTMNDLSTQPWTAVPANIAFTINYQLVPEPDILALLCFGGLALLGRRRN